MDVDISAGRVAGRTQAPPSKSYTHRAILAAGYGEGATIHGPLVSADTRATMRAVDAFGGSVEHHPDDGTLEIEGFGGEPAVPDDVIDCANSGTTMRLVTAAAALVDGGLAVLTGDESLRSRPQQPLLQAIDQLGGRAESTRGNGQAPLVVGGPITGGSAAIPGDVSSQFVTALLMAGAVTDAGVDVTLQTELKSAPYVDITIDVLEDFGVSARQTGRGFSAAGFQRYDPGGAYTVPGDFSSMSYLLAAGALAGDEAVTVTGAHPSAQGDQAILDVLDDMGTSIDWDRDAGEITVSRSDLTGVEVGVADTPDLLPTIAVLGAAADGTTTITDCEHVRYKETDRVTAMAESLSAMGATVEEAEETLTIHGSDSELAGTTLDGRGDHRIVMALAVAGLVADGTTTITGAEHVDVSFPEFFDVLAGLGAPVERR
jgi:3-phosphoshikimate 1-carboxyvinyltransferase